MNKRVTAKSSLTITRSCIFLFSSNFFLFILILRDFFLIIKSYKKIIRVSSFRSRCRCEKGTVNSSSLYASLSLACLHALLWNEHFLLIHIRLECVTFSMSLCTCSFCFIAKCICYRMKKERKREREKRRPHESNDDTKIKHDSNRRACALVLNSYRTTRRKTRNARFQLQQKN